MFDLIHVGKRVIPLEEVALFEPYQPAEDTKIRTSRDLKSRIVLLDRDSVLCERTPEDLGREYGFRFIAPDRVATNVAVRFWVEKFEPTDTFKPEKPFATRLLWNGRDGTVRSKLLLADPEAVIASVVRGEQAAEEQPDHSEVKPPKRPRSRVRRNSQSDEPGPTA